MTLPPYTIRVKTGFQMLSKEAQDALTKYEYAVIILTVLIAVSSIVWSASLHILSSDLYNGIFGAKVVFHKRDFNALSNQEKNIFYNDLWKLINETYTETAAQDTNETDPPNSERHVMPAESGGGDQSDGTTSAKPKTRKTVRLFQLGSILNGRDADDDDDAEKESSEAMEVNQTAKPKVKFDVKADRTFLARMTIDVHNTRWHDGFGVDFVNNFPFLSEIVAIVWAAMCLIYQANVKRLWGLPKPWRIVVPSMVAFSFMSIASLIYIIMANGYLNHFCKDLRAPLSNPNAVSCGEAMSILRPIINRHEFRHDVYLTLFRISYVITHVLWLIALLVMVLRYIFAIDFQLVDIHLHPTSLSAFPETKYAQQPNEFIEVPLRSPAHQTKLLHVDERKNQRSDEDFYSAKSQLSEAATPLLEHTQQQAKIM